MATNPITKEEVDVVGENLPPCYYCGVKPSIIQTADLAGLAHSDGSGSCAVVCINHECFVRPSTGIQSQHVAFGIWCGQLGKHYG